MGWSGWSVQGRLNRPPSFPRRVGRPGRARGQFDTRHARSGWRQALPWACPGDATGGHGELVFLAVDSAGRFVGAGRRNSACIAGTGIVPARGHPAWTGLQRCLPYAGRIQVVERGADPAAGKQPRHWLAASGRRSVHAPAMPASPAPAIPAFPPAVDPCTHQRSPDMLHPMIAGQPARNRAAITAITRRGSESRSLALVPATRNAPALFSPWRAKISRGLRGCYVISTLVGLRQDRRWGLPVLRF